MKFFSNDYYTIIAENKEQAVRFFKSQELTDEEGLSEIREVDPTKKKMLFPVDELPEKYHDEGKYPRKDWFGEYTEVEITLQEAAQYRKEKLPYIICISSEVAM